MNKKKHHKTIVISDLHLGSKWCKSDEVICYLKHNTCDTLILCGDIIDGWNIMRGKKGKWKRKYTDFIKLILDIQHETKIIYLRGNHDDFLDKVVPMKFQNIEIVRDYLYTSGENSYYILHGDVFDKVTSRFSWLAKLGDVGYTFLLWVNKVYNQKRLKKGLPYYSLSKEIKNKIKLSVSYISDFEKHIVDIARAKKCKGVICGHIHHPEIKKYNEILYLNSGDWVESLSALTEDYQGNWSLYYYKPEDYINLEDPVNEFEEEYYLQII
ncbi:UDP-2,3-diacylglucosamine diphosphatase [Apibacter raozihei]|uniref:UDP-2,3-diacylglucosamine diphosphatase n=1 Tax=Apibacter TaxID=1778601 RepID=UPI000FE397A0|nr:MULTISPECIES: UDP-2,3-diacylglucosamine diphosphatase [Apibacter]